MEGVGRDKVGSGKIGMMYEFSEVGRDDLLARIYIGE